MFCPFCLDNVRFVRKRLVNNPASVYICPNCNERVPALLVQDHHEYPPIVVDAIGYKQHGKSVYFAALSYVLKKLTLARDWPDLFCMGLDEDSLDAWYGYARMMEGKGLPLPTLRNFPRPIIMRLEGISLQPDCTLLIYDTGGDCFEEPGQLVQFAGYVRRAKASLLMVSISDLEDREVCSAMQKLLNTFAVGLGELGEETRNQHLIVTYTKADRFLARFSREWEDLRTYLINGYVDRLQDQSHSYKDRMYYISERLLEFTRQELHAQEFIDEATSNFKSLNFTLVSALGPQPDENGLLVDIDPRCLLDPLLWVVDKTLCT